LNDAFAGHELDVDAGDVTVVHGKPAADFGADLGPGRGESGVLLGIDQGGVNLLGSGVESDGLLDFPGHGGGLVEALN